MAIFRRKNKLQLIHLRSVVTKAVYAQNDFPTIDLTITVKDDDNAKVRSDLTEVTVSMNLFEATQLLRELQLKVTNATRLYTPHNAINIPWGENQ